jgi:hypothetical protein
MCTYILAATLIGAAAIGIGLYFGVFSTQDLGNVASTFGDNFGKILGTDPFAGRGGINGTVYSWVGSTGKGGLTLELLNALDDNWQTYFAQAISDWDSGTPDALTLSTSRVTAESACSSVDGKMKVCNGDYGDTGWRGINELMLTSNDKIVSSVAKMNEYYLKSSTSSLDKQYTMCHEVGHGFGLPHTDENFMNVPEGNCLDYSNNVAPNQKPGQINYDKLAAVYGVVSGGRRRRQREVSDAAAATMRDHSESAPDWAKSTFREKIDSFVVGVENEGWSLIHQHPLGEIHAIDLGGGYRGHINVLLV